MHGLAAAPEQGGVSASPSLALDGFTGPLERLLVLARAHELDIARLSLPAFCDQFSAALLQASGRVPLSQQGEWLAMAAWFILLRSRLLLPPETPAGQGAPTEAEQGRERLAGRDVQALAAWLARRPQLGTDMFARGRPEFVGAIGGAEHEIDVIEFLWAALVLFDADLPAAETAPRYRPVWLDLYGVADARARIRRLLGETTDGRVLAQLLPVPDPEAPPSGALKRRSAWTSTFVAGLELAKQGEVLLHQENGFAPIHVVRPPAELR
jgi:segregation and condensation protein A